MKNAKILLVHRHAGARAFLKKGLEQQSGCEVIMGFSCSSALTILKLEDIRAAFVDLRAPECASLALVHHLQKVRPDLPIFGLADYPSKFEIQACREAGLQGYFTMPFNITALVNAIEKIATSSSIHENAAVS